MLGLPKQTEISKQLPKKAIYERFGLNTQQRDRFDANISRITIVNEISPSTTSIATGADVSAIYVLLVSLKQKEYDTKVIAMIPKLIEQKMILLLEYEDECRFAVLYGKLMESKWTKTETVSLNLQGLDLDKIWENIIIRIGSITVEQGNSLDEQIDLDTKQKQIEQEIEKLEKAARREIQPKKKFELVKKISELRKEFQNG